MSSSKPPAPLLEPPGGGPSPRRYYAPMYARKRLTPPERLTAAGVGLAVGATVAYVFGLWMQRRPLVADDDARPARASGTRSRA